MEENIVKEVEEIEEQNNTNEDSNKEVTTFKSLVSQLYRDFVGLVIKIELI